MIKFQPRLIKKIEKNIDKDKKIIIIDRQVKSLWASNIALIYLYYK